MDFLAYGNDTVSNAHEPSMTLTSSSPLSLYSEEFATFEKDTVYNQRDAEGFIRLNALRLRMRKMSEEKARS